MNGWVHLWNVPHIIINIRIKSDLFGKTISILIYDQILQSYFLRAFNFLLWKMAEIEINTIQFQINIPGTFINFWCVVRGVRSYLEGVRLLNFDHLVLIVICSNLQQCLTHTLKISRKKLNPLKLIGSENPAYSIQFNRKEDD